MEAYSQITLASRPKGLPTPSDFRLETGAIPAPAEGQILLKTTYLSLDPYMRGRMKTPNPMLHPSTSAV